MSGNFEIEIRVPYADTDLMGTVYYSHYLEYFERARVELLRHLGFPHSKLEKEGGVHLAVTEAFCKYIKPCCYDDILIVRPRITEMGSASIMIEYEILNKETQVLIVKGSTKLAFVDEKIKVCRAPRDMAQKLKEIVHSS
jgi:acyl-CoA thioester hydrolase